MFRSLFQIGLGRNSTLFQYDPDKQCFLAIADKFRASGLSLACSQSVVDWFLHIGNLMRRQQALVAGYETQEYPFPTYAALLNGIDTALRAIEKHSLKRLEHIVTILQLQKAFEPVQSLSEELSTLVELVRPCKTDQEFLSQVYAHVRDLDQRDDSLVSTLMRSFLQRIVRPFLMNIEHWTGLSACEGIFSTAVREDENESERHSLPSFIMQDDWDLILETKKCFNFLQLHHPDYFSSRAISMAQACTKLDWAFDLDDISRINAKARDYKDNLVSALQDCKPGKISKLEAKGASVYPVEDGKVAEDPADLAAAFNETSSKFAETLPSPFASQYDSIDNGYEQLCALLYAYLDTSIPQDISSKCTVRPPLALSFSLSISPFLKIQHQLYAHACMNFILHNQTPSSRLQEHLALHHRFSLFASPAKSSIYPFSLADTLFSADLATSERFKGKPRTGAPMGLRLGTGTRRAWPPASSELQLALGDVLGRARTYQGGPSEGLHAELEPSTLHAITLPGNLAFTIRTDVSEAEIEKILDSNSIHALDFLKLGYVPPPHLRFLFNRKTLDRYDAVFALQLKLLRVRFALDHNDISHNALRRPILKARTLVNSISSYFQHQGIAAPWQSLESAVRSLEKTCGSPFPDFASDAGTSDSVASLDALARKHSGTLDAINANLLLRKKQVRLREAMESWLQSCLDLCQSPADTTAPTHSFETRTWAFVSELRVMAKDAGGGTVSDTRTEAQGARGVLQVFEEVCAIS